MIVDVRKGQPPVALDGQDGGHDEWGHIDGMHGDGLSGSSSLSLGSGSGSGS